jgi:replicative DNA helicase
MSKVINKTTLGFLGTDYQYKLVSSFVNDPSFFVDLSAIIDQNMFTEQYLKKIVGIMKDYYNKRGSVPRYDIILLKMQEDARTEDDVQYCTETIDKLKSQTTEGIDEIEDMAEKFFKQQNWVRVANEIKRIAGDGDISKYDDCQRLMEEAMSVGRKYEVGESPWENIDAKMSQENVVPITTGITKLDKTLGGGLYKGDVGLLIAGLGFGKTSMTTSMAHAAATCKCYNNDYKGFKVLHIVFEDTVRQISRKYFSKVTQVETRLLNQDEETARAVTASLKDYEDAEMMLNNIKIIRLATGEVTATEIKEKIKRKINEGFRPDLVIIDYFDCLAPEKGTGSLSKWEQEGKTMRKLENMAKDLNIAIWIPTQGNKGSITSPDVVTMDQAGGSIRKVQICQVVISIARSLDDIDKNKATLAVLKNRSGKSGEIFEGIRFNNGTSTISCDEVETFNSALSYFEKAEQVEENKHKEQMALAKQIREKIETEEFSVSEF